MKPRSLTNGAGQKVRVVEDPETGERYRIVSVKEWVQKPHLPVTRGELFELLQVYEWNRQMHRVGPRLARAFARLTGNRKLFVKWSRKGSLRIRLGRSK